MSNYDLPGLSDKPVQRNGKGSRRRGDAEAKAKFDANYDAIFRKKKKRTKKK